MGLLVVVLISFFVNLIKLLHVIGNLMRRRVYPKVKAYLHLLKKRFIKSEAVVKMRPAPSIHTGRGNKTMEDFVHEQSMIKNYFPEASE